MSRDPEVRSQQIIDENQKRMDEIKVEKPDTYFNEGEWKVLKEANRLHNVQIERIKKMKQRGVKF